MITQIIWMGYAVAEVTCPTKYFPEASSIDFLASIKYGFGCLKTAFDFRMAKMKILKSKRYPQH
jgi:hypothetical protein